MNPAGNASANLRAGLRRQAKAADERDRAAQAAARAAQREVTLIQIGRSALRLDDGTYRDMLARLCGGKTSSKALTAAERQKVLDHMKAAGFVVKPKPGGNRLTAEGWRFAPQLLKLRAMWWALAEAGHVEPPADVDGCTAAVEAWAKRQLASATPPLDALRFASAAQMDTLVESLRAWCRRVGVATR